MNRIRTARSLLGIAGLSVCLAGCSNKFFDPGQVGRFRPTPAVNVILDSLGVAEETPVAWENAEEPQPGDIVAVKTDYALRPGDLVRISIFELFQEGVPLVNDYIVSETGKISIPTVGVIQAAGLSETQLEEEVKRILTPGILREPSVTVTLISSQQRTFSILGNAVSRAGRYTIPRYDFRLMDALAVGGAQTQFNVSYVYVSRWQETVGGPLEGQPEGPMRDLELLEPESSSGREPSIAPGVSESSGSARPVRQMKIPEPSEPAEEFELEREMLEMITPQARKSWPQSQKVVGVAAPVADAQADVQATAMPYGFRLLVSPKSGRMGKSRPPSPLVSPTDFGPSESADTKGTSLEGKERIEWIFRDGKWIPVPVKSGGIPQPPPAVPKADGQLEWVFRDGRWVPTDGKPGPGQAPIAVRPEGPVLPIESEKLPMELEWEQAIQTRLIQIPTEKLLAGDPRYNVIIKPGDTIHVPVDIIGEFAIMGNVNRSGFINITGRPMTLKMAIAAAGGLGPLAWPKHVEVVRRIGTKKEEIVLVDLDKIAAGEQPDFFIKPNDLINVGTHPTSRWRAVLRNAFRAAYGFGFVYDRNFADADYGKGFDLPHWL